jgi:hypothetical protein
MYTYPPNAPQDNKLLTSQTYEDYTISVSSQLDAGHSLVHLFNEILTDVWATSVNEYQTTRYPGLDYSGAWIRVELPFPIYATGIKLTSRIGIYFDQRPKNFRVYGQTSGGQPWNVLGDFTGATWAYSGGSTPDQTKDFSFSTNNVAYKNFLIVMQNNYYEESTVDNKNIHILQYISLAEYKIMGYPAPASALQQLPNDITNASVSSLTENTAVINFTPPSIGSPIINYEYSLDNGQTFIAFSPAITTSPVTITGLTGATAYAIRLRGINATGTGSTGNSISVTTASPPFVGDAIIASLTTSLPDYNAANSDNWVKITSTEYAALQTNISRVSKAGASDLYMSSGTGSGFTNANAIIGANSVTSNTPAIIANSYIFAFAVKWAGAASNDELQVYANTNATTNNGFNKVGGALPTTASGSGLILNYYVRKAASQINSSSNGLLALFTGSKKYSTVNVNFSGSGGYLGFNYIGTASAPVMKYNSYAPSSSLDVPTSSTVLTGALSNYGALLFQALTTTIKQWN